tara:strand:- start:13 stop:255 length:243 start_codon:yes stop_codon:yes gene_type:complete
MGVWNHFYSNSGPNESISTRYVNQPHFVRFLSKPTVLGDDQRDNWGWFDLDKVVRDKDFHQHVRDYAGYLINKGVHDVRN